MFPIACSSVGEVEEVGTEATPAWLPGGAEDGLGGVSGTPSWVTNWRDMPFVVWE